MGIYLLDYQVPVIEVLGHQVINTSTLGCLIERELFLLLISGMSGVDPPVVVVCLFL